MSVSKKVRIADLKANLSRHLREVKAGETITVMERETPVAVLTAYASSNSQGLEVRPPIASPAKIAKLRSPLKEPIKSFSSSDVLTELRGDK